MQRSFYHEIGHHILERLPAQILDEIAVQGAQAEHRQYRFARATTPWSIL